MATFENASHGQVARFINLPLMHFSINFRKCYRVRFFGKT